MKTVTFCQQKPQKPLTTVTLGPCYTLHTKTNMHLVTGAICVFLHPLPDCQWMSPVDDSKAKFPALQPVYFVTTNIQLKTKTIAF